jgi:hypothetical protein
MYNPNNLCNLLLNLGESIGLLWTPKARGWLWKHIEMRI